MIQRALISCTDKTGIVPFAEFLAKRGVELLSTGGTAKILREAGLKVKDVSEFTGFPEMLDGRVKTLHPKVHGGLLHVRGNPSHVKQVLEHGIAPIDLVVVNLYEFEKTVAKPGSTLEDAIENIDIGGPSMLRSAAKNHHDVVVIVDPADYVRVQDEITANGDVAQKTRFELAVKVFRTTARYDAAISSHLGAQLEGTAAVSASFPSSLTVNLVKAQDLRYGENPHQLAAFYRDESAASGIAAARQLQGKELSFNNILDLDAAYRCCAEFQAPACVIVKHTNPCGVGLAETLPEAFLKARAADPVSCFGGIVALSRPVDAPTATLLAETFFEAIVAPGYSDDALKILASKKNLRVMILDAKAARDAKQMDMRRVSGGLLVQEADLKLADPATCEVVTKRKPTAKELHDLMFAWTVVKHVKSNAIVYAKDGQTLGVGAGQMSRVDSVRIAANKAEEIFKDAKVLKGSVLASDAFFPFRDGLDTAAKVGITAVVQPGGSVRDAEVIAAADEQNIAMVFTRERHFKH
jgi:phosphoribosylaminoimidazolecarboxamide formyltransferase/IMP cyclohydrolase